MITMTTNADLSTYPMGDEPQHNLQRMFADMKRVEFARRFVDDVLRGGTDVSIIAVDLDRSAVVRRRGVREKRHLVVQLHEVVRAALPEKATFLDSGSRDEGWIVLTTDDPHEPSRLAEQLHQLIGKHDFRLIDGDGVRLTASLGVARSPLHGRTGQDLLWAVGEALWHAKLTRDAVHVADAPVEVQPQTFPITVEQQRQLDALSRRTGRSVDSLFHEALHLLLENHAPRWHWIVEKRGPTAGGPPRHGAESA
ncbi:hypothetical protein [Nonomuraea diastatica]|uniref:GGDEF domain-containing protein n=1 Tax=Nonomuraea diastatica TaxID=1848329 RepID=A0A4R4VZP1_9ACTN|nr:hypothetical protein [Nonomuraea diastatica]TDD11648.1 hypothetical protein E1294_44850 [Nonomuraea diastatica]